MCSGVHPCKSEANVMCAQTITPKSIKCNDYQSSLVETANFVAKDITVLLEGILHLTYRLRYVLYIWKSFTNVGSPTGNAFAGCCTRNAFKPIIFHSKWVMSYVLLENIDLLENLDGDAGVLNRIHAVTQIKH